MRVSILQRDIIWADPASNIRAADEAIDRQRGADLYVLPEMFSTGFAMQPDGLAEPNDGETLHWMKCKAAQCKAAIAGSVAVNDDGRFYNRFYFVQPNGCVDIYDKRHLFTYSGEDKCFTRGNERVIVAFRGIRFLLEVCYDLRFPVWSRNQKDYDCILYVANWPTSRIAAWSTLLRARAIENQCFVVGVNRVGRDPQCEYCGASVILDPYGNAVATCETNRECEAVAQLDMTSLTKFRQEFPVLNDADAFLMKK